MSQAPAAPAAPSEQEIYHQASGLLARGEISAGAHLLAQLAENTADDALESLCLYNLGEVLDRLGESTKAYETWYRLAHKPAEQRNRTDRLAHSRVMRQFESKALKFRVPEFPPRVQLEISNRCNLRCIMCTRNQMTRSTGNMSYETFVKVADECVRHDDVIMCLYFLGEPLLNRELERMCAYVRSAMEHAGTRLLFGLQTNGMLMDRDRARSLLESGLRSFAFSVDGLEGDLERVRPGASYPVVERNILGLLDVAREMGLDDLKVDISKLCDDPESEETRAFHARWGDKVDNIHLLGINKVEGNAYLGADGEIHQIGGITSDRRWMYCGQGSRLLIHWNGDFAFCCSDVNAELALGNIHDRSIHQTWHSDEMQRIRRKIVKADYEGLAPCLHCSQSRR